jgi:carboxyl-terminal processing protease
MKRLLNLLWLAPLCGLLAADPDPAAPRQFKPLRPGEHDGIVAQVTGKLLEQFHFRQQKVNDDMASRFLDRYVEMFDSQKMLLLQPDMEFFEVYRTTLDDLTMESLDVSPAHVIYARFMERLEQRHKLVMDLLARGEKDFQFTGSERYLFNRKDAQRPGNLEEARALWRDQLRNEYLAEKLTVDTKKSPVPAKDGKPAKSTHETIVETLTKRYNRVLDYYSKRDSDDVLDYYLTALSMAYDPHSDYMGRAAKENFKISMGLSLSGIGAQLTDEDGYCTISKLIKGGPAIKSKQLKEKDRIVAVAQAEKEPVDVVGLKLDKVVELIRGPKDTEVRLTIIPADAADVSVRRVVTLVRDEIKLEDQEAKGKIIELPGAAGQTTRIGIIDLPSFYGDTSNDPSKPASERKSTTRDVSILLQKFKDEKVAGVVLDFRRNGGGYLEEAVKLTGQFIKQGPVVKVINSLGQQQLDEDKDPSVFYDGPLVVLTDRHSASASEIVAGALQDYGRALVVGESSTHGKGTVQTVLEMRDFMRGLPGLSFDPGSVKLTIRQFYLPGGKSTQLYGVTPDIVLPSANNHADIGERELDNPLPADSTSPAKFEKLDRVEAHLPELRKRSETRVLASRDFDYIRDDIERFKKMKAERTVSLNEQERRKEREEITARIEARKKEIQARPAANQKTYAFTVEEARKPGLPAPEKPDSLAQAVDGTNGAPVGASAKSGSGDEDGDGEEPKTPEVDALLNETVQILVDYINLLSKNRPVTAATGGKE